MLDADFLRLTCAIGVGNGDEGTLPHCGYGHICSNDDLIANCILGGADLPCLELHALGCGKSTFRQGVLGTLIHSNISHGGLSAVSVKAYGNVLGESNCIGGEELRINGDHTVTDNDLLSVTVRLGGQRLNIAAAAVAGMVTEHREVMSVLGFEGNNDHQKTCGRVDLLLIMNNIIDRRGLLDLNIHKDQLFALLCGLFLDRILHTFNDLLCLLRLDRQIDIDFDRLAVILRIVLQLFHDLIGFLFQTANQDIRSTGLNFNRRADLIFRQHNSFNGNVLLNIDQNRHRLTVMLNHQIVDTIIHVYKEVVSVNIGGSRSNLLTALSQGHLCTADTNSVDILNLTGHGNRFVGHIGQEGQCHCHACVLAIEVHLAIRNQAKMTHIVVDTAKGKAYHLDLMVIAFTGLICLILPNRIRSGVSDLAILTDDGKTLNTEVLCLLGDDLILIQIGTGFNGIQNLHIDGSGDTVTRYARIKSNTPCRVETFGAVCQNSIEHGDINAIIADRLMVVIQSNSLNSVCADSTVFRVLRTVTEGIACLRIIAVHLYRQINIHRIDDMTIAQQRHSHHSSTLVHILRTGLDRAIVQRIRVGVIDAQVTRDLDRGDQSVIVSQFHDLAGSICSGIIEHFAAIDVVLVGQIHILTIQHVANDLELVVIAAAHVGLILPNRIAAGVSDRIAVGDLNALSTITDSLLSNDLIVLQRSACLSCVEHLHIDRLGNRILIIPVDSNLPLSVKALGTVVQRNRAITAAVHTVVMVLRHSVITQRDSLNSIGVSAAVLVGQRHILEHIGCACRIAGHHSRHNDGFTGGNTVFQQGNTNLGGTLAFILRTALHTTVGQSVGVGVVEAHSTIQVGLCDLCPNSVQGRVTGQAGIIIGFVFCILRIGGFCPTLEDIALAIGFHVTQVLIFAAQSLGCRSIRTAVCVIGNHDGLSAILHRLIVLVRTGNCSQIELITCGQLVKDQFAVNGVSAINLISISSLQRIVIIIVQTGEGQRVTVRHANDLSFLSGLGINGHAGIDGGSNFLRCGIILIDLTILVLCRSHDHIGGRLLQAADDDIAANTLNPAICIGSKLIAGLIRVSNAVQRLSVFIQDLVEQSSFGILDCDGLAGGFHGSAGNRAGISNATNLKHELHTAAGGNIQPGHGHTGVNAFHSGHDILAVNRLRGISTTTGGVIGIRLSGTIVSKPESACRGAAIGRNNKRGVSTDRGCLGSGADHSHLLQRIVLDRTDQRSIIRIAAAGIIVTKLGIASERKRLLSVRQISLKDESVGISLIKRDSQSVQLSVSSIIVAATCRGCRPTAVHRPHVRIARLEHIGSTILVIQTFYIKVCTIHAVSHRTVSNIVTVGISRPVTTVIIRRDDLHSLTGLATDHTAIPCTAGRVGEGIGSVGSTGDVSVSTVLGGAALPLVGGAILQRVNDQCHITAGHILTIGIAIVADDGVVVIGLISAYCHSRTVNNNGGILGEFLDDVIPEVTVLVTCALHRYAVSGHDRQSLKRIAISREDRDGCGAIVAAQRCGISILCAQLAVVVIGSVIQPDFGITIFQISLIQSDDIGVLIAAGLATFKKSQHFGNSAEVDIQLKGIVTVRAIGEDCFMPMTTVDNNLSRAAVGIAGKVVTPSKFTINAKNHLGVRIYVVEVINSRPISIVGEIPLDIIEAAIIENVVRCQCNCIIRIINVICIHFGQIDVNRKVIYDITADRRALGHDRIIGLDGTIFGGRHDNGGEHILRLKGLQLQEVEADNLVDLTLFIFNVNAGSFCQRRFKRSFVYLIVVGNNGELNAVNIFVGVYLITGVCIIKVHFILRAIHPPCAGVKVIDSDVVSIGVLNFRGQLALAEKVLQIRQSLSDGTESHTLIEHNVNGTEQGVTAAGYTPLCVQSGILSNIDLTAGLKDGTILRSCPTQECVALLGGIAVCGQRICSCNNGDIGHGAGTAAVGIKCYSKGRSSKNLCCRSKINIAVCRG